MGRNAATISLMLHAGLISWMGWQCHFLSAGGGAPGSCNPEISLLAETASPPVNHPVPEKLYTGEEFLPPVPVEQLPQPKISPIVALTPVAEIAFPVPVIDPVSLAAAPPESGAATEKQRAYKISRRKRGGTGGKLVAGAGGAGAGSGGNGTSANGYVPPHFRVRYKPSYPKEARANRIEGVVLLLVSIDTGGHVTNAELISSSGHVMLDRAALSSVRAWQFEPARNQGHSVAARVEIPVRFRIEDQLGA